jgi:shikimate kinase
MPASGMSTLGVQLAMWLSMGFIDTDMHDQARIRVSMQDFQHANGMEAYQTLECETVNSLVCANCVIATGGSAVYCNESMKHLQGLAKIIFLDLPVAEVEQRIGGMAERGVVIQPDMTLDDLHAERHPLYLNYADGVVNCSGKTPNELLAEIRALV